VTSLPDREPHRARMLSLMRDFVAGTTDGAAFQDLFMRAWKETRDLVLAAVAKWPSRPDLELKRRLIAGVTAGSLGYQNRRNHRSPGSPQMFRSLIVRSVCSGLLARRVVARPEASAS
jgi:hypothetical protein